MFNMQKMYMFMFHLVTFSYKLHESCKRRDCIFKIKKDDIWQEKFSSLHQWILLLAV